MRKAACKFCRNTLQYDVAKQLEQDGISPDLFSIEMDITDVTTIDPEKIFVNYKSLFADNQGNNTENYIKPVVVLEVNGRSMKEPLEKVTIQSFIDEVFAERPFAEKSFEINVVAPERTFLEKVCLLHEEFAKKDQERIRVNRMSRHIYDIARMLDTPIAEKALNDKELYKHIVAHRRIFQAMKNFDYDTLFPDKISIIPPDSVIDKWEDDYKKMQTMMYGESPSFSIIIEKLTQLTERINKIVW